MPVNCLKLDIPEYDVNTGNELNKMNTRETLEISTTVAKNPVNSSRSK